jgi:hypothetical protein
MSPRRPSAARRTVSVVTLAFLGFALPAACDATPELEAPGCDDTLEICGGTKCGTNEDCHEGRFCSSKSTCVTRCSTCGSSCDAGAPCPTGQFCSGSKTCEQECSPGAESGCGVSPEGKPFLCGSNGECTENVRVDLPPDEILPSGGSTGSGGTSSQGGMGGGEGCIKAEVEFTPVIPNVVLLIDQSLSMTDGEGFGALVEQEIAAGTYTPWGCPTNEGDPPDSPDQEDYDWRWNVVRSVLFNPVGGVVPSIQDSVRFGMALYSSENGSIGGTSCPILTEVPIVEADVNFQNYDAMLAQMRCGELITDTPTRESLAATADKFALLDIEGPKIIVLATDGEPDNCDCPNWTPAQNPPEECLDSEETNWVERGVPPVLMKPSEAEQYDVVQEAKRVYEELGITVHVIDVSKPNNASLRQHLTDVAHAANGEIYDGTKPSGLVDAFQTIVDGVRSCVIDLKGMILEEKQDEGTVTLDGATLTYLPDGIGDGWKLNTPSQLELVGEPCELIKSGKHDIKVDFPCDVFVPEEIPE